MNMWEGTPTEVTQLAGIGSQIIIQHSHDGGDDESCYMPYTWLFCHCPNEQQITWAFRCWGKHDIQTFNLNGTYTYRPTLYAKGSQPLRPQPPF